MVDYSTLSDKELQAAYEKERREQAPTPAAAAVDYSKLSDEELKAQHTKEQAGKMSWLDTGADALKGFGSGVLHEGVSGLLGMGGDVRDLTGEATAKVANVIRKVAGAEPLTEAEYARAKSRGVSLIPAMPHFLTSKLPTSEDVKGKISNVVPEYTPKTETGRYAKNVGAFAPAVLAGPEVLGPKLLSSGGKAFAKYALAPGLMSEGAKDLAHEVVPGYENWAYALGGMAAPSLASVARTPFRIPAENKAMEAALKARGIEATAGDVTQREGLRGLEADLKPGVKTQQNDQITREALKQIGLDAERVETHPSGNLAQRAAEITQERKALNARNELHSDRMLSKDLLDPINKRVAVGGEYGENSINAARAFEKDVSEALEASVANGKDRWTKGKLSGEAYGTIRDRYLELAKNAKSETKAALYEQIEHLDNAMGRSIIRHNPQDAGKYLKNRAHAKNLEVINDAVETGGGHLSVDKLASAAKRVYGEDYRKRDPFSGFVEPAARLGVGKSVARSEIIPKLGASIGTSGGAAVGSYLGGGGHDAAILGAIIGGAGGWASEGLMRGLTRPFVTSGKAQQWLKNTSMPNTPLPNDPAKQLVMIRALLGQR